MLIFLVIAVLVLAILVQFGLEKQAAYGGTLALVGAFAYRAFVVGDSLRTLTISAALCVGIIAIGLWAAKDFERITDKFKHTR